MTAGARGPTIATSRAQRYDHPSGLSFTYPQRWEMQEFSAQSRVGLFAPTARARLLSLPPIAARQVDPGQAGQESLRRRLRRSGKTPQGRDERSPFPQADASPIPIRASYPPTTKASPRKATARRPRRERASSSPAGACRPWSASRRTPPRWRPTAISTDLCVGGDGRR